MGDRFGFRLLAGALVIAALAVVGFYSYNLGVAQGVAEGGRLIASPGGGVPVVIWPRPWGFGFGFFPFFPLLFILFWLFILRGIFWRGGWHRRSRWHEGVPPQFDEWHRRAHAEQGARPAAASDSHV
jgi:hypothetical protein